MPSCNSRPVRRLGFGSLAAALGLAAAAASPAHADIVNGLKASYDFNSLAAIGVDGSGNGNTGTLSANNAGWANDLVRGGVLTLNGAQGNPGFLLVPDSPSVSITGDLTISAFINITTTTNLFNSIVGKTNGNQPASYDLYVQANNGVPRLFRGNGLGANGNSDASAAVPINQWHMLTVTQGGTAVNYYLDGAFLNTGTPIGATGADTDNPLYIGSRGDLFTALNGSMDAVRIYNRALSAGDVAELYVANTPEPGFGGLAVVGACAAMARRRRRASPATASKLAR